MRRIAIAVLLGTAALASAARAQAMKFGYVDVQRAIQEVEEGRAARTRLKGEYDQRRAQIDKKSGDLERMQQEYEKQAPVLSDDAKRKKQEDRQSKQNPCWPFQPLWKGRVASGICSLQHGFPRE